MTARTLCWALVCTWLCATRLALAQDSLSFQTFMQRVAAHHPVAQQAALIEQQAQAELQQARGGMDPVLSGQRVGKKFKNDLYYDDTDVALKAPIAGIFDVSLGYENNFGDFLNPENTTGGTYVNYLGLSVPLLRGLILDDRRAALQKARMLPQLGQAERQKVVNKLLLDAGKTYWAWWAAWQLRTLANEAVALADFRYTAIAAAVVNGDRAPIDTVEARLEVIRRQVQQAEAQLIYTNIRLALATYLWQAGQQPDSLKASTQPQRTPTPIPEAPVDSLAQHATQSHPEVLALRIKLDQLTIDQRLAKWNLLPRVDAEFKPYVLSSGFNIPWQQNYRWGVYVYFPLFLRKERGKLQETRIKWQQTQTQLANATRLRMNDVLQQDNQYQMLAQLVARQQENLSQTQRMLNAEAEMLRNGESSLFLINQRERAVVEARAKLIEYQTKQVQVALERSVAAGIAPIAVLE